MHFHFSSAIYGYYYLFFLIFLAKVLTVTTRLNGLQRRFEDESMTRRGSKRRSRRRASRQPDMISEFCHVFSTQRNRQIVNTINLKTMQALPPGGNVL